jgi:hypothetical protein
LRGYKGPFITKKAIDLRRHICGAHNKCRHWACTQCPLEAKKFCSKKDLLAHCTKQGHTSDNAKYTDDVLYCDLELGGDYKWKDEDLSFEMLAELAAAPAPAPAPENALQEPGPGVGVTATGNTIS